MIYGIISEWSGNRGGNKIIALEEIFGAIIIVETSDFVSVQVGAYNKLTTSIPKTSRLAVVTQNIVFPKVYYGVLTVCDQSDISTERTYHVEIESPGDSNNHRIYLMAIDQVVPANTFIVGSQYLMFKNN